MVDRAAAGGDGVGIVLGPVDVDAMGSANATCLSSDDVGESTVGERRAVEGKVSLKPARGGKGGHSPDLRGSLKTSPLSTMVLNSSV